MRHEDIAAALQRVESVLTRRPESGLHDDSEAKALWQGGLRVVASHTDGTQVESDMPGEFGGTGDKVTPGWLFRAGTASCTATSIALSAARQGIALDALEVTVNSRSDARGILALHDADGGLVPSRPLGMTMRVRVAAEGVAPARLRAVVEDACRCSPIADAVRHPVPLSVDIAVQGEARGEDAAAA